MFRFTSLGSGSRGNATVIQAGSACVMLDCGFSETRVRERLAARGLSPTELSAILVTHEHSDHINGVGAVARKHGIPVYMTRGTAAQDRHGTVPELNLIDVHDRLVFGELEVQAFPVPHDAREPVQFVFKRGESRLAILTDTGSSTQHIGEMLDACDALVLECNHDPGMLASGPYPEPLKQRVGGRFGHLSNSQAAELLAGLDCSRLQHLVAAHISDKNNTPLLASQALAAVLGQAGMEILVAEQDDGHDWLEIR